jgi:pyruvate dehydrogenase E1 component alpha subunit
LSEKHSTEEELKSIDKKIREIVGKSAEFAMADPLPDDSELYTDILVEA